MQGKNRSRRGTGHLYQKDDRWYGQWYVRGARVKRSLGPVRQPGASDGLTKRQAQARMLDAMTATDSAPAPVTERLTVEEVGKRRIRELARKGRKQDTTLANYESEIRCHFVPHFGQVPIAEVTEDDVADFLDACLNNLSVKTVRNLYVHLNAIFEFAMRKRWCHANPCKLVDKPASVADDDAEIRFLDQAELDALLAAPAPRRHSKRTLERAARARKLRDQGRLQWKAIGDALGCSPATAVYLYRATAENAADEDLWQVDVAIYVTAAMTGLRQGELLGLRWRDAARRSASLAAGHSAGNLDDRVADLIHIGNCRSAHDSSRAGHEIGCSSPEVSPVRKSRVRWLYRGESPAWSAEEAEA